MKRTKTIRVSEEFAEFLEGLRMSIQVDTGRRYSYPDFSDLLLDNIVNNKGGKNRKRKKLVFNYAKLGI